MQVFPFDLKDNEYIQLMNSLEVSDSGISIMEGRFGTKTFIVTDISTPAANVVKQHVLALGGEAAVPAYSVNCSKPKCDLIFSVRKDKLPPLLKKFRTQCWKLPEVANIIENYLKDKAPWFSFRHDLIDVSKPSVMGILNVTPDSFSDGGNYTRVEKAVEQAFKMAEDGADIIDIGGESVRPGFIPISAEDELNRVMPVIIALKKDHTFPLPISIDTYKAAVAEEALKMGVEMVNDVYGFKADQKLAKVVADYNVPICLMHNRSSTDYKNLIADIIEEINESIQLAHQAGIKDEQIIIDPGIGFGKDLQQNLDVMYYLREFNSLGYPLLLGTSRKSMIGKTLHLPLEKRVEGTAATVAYGISAGVSLVRVHDVLQMRRVADMTDAMVRR